MTLLSDWVYLVCCIRGVRILNCFDSFWIKACDVTSCRRHHRYLKHLITKTPGSCAPTIAGEGPSEVAGTHSRALFSWIVIVPSAVVLAIIVSKTVRERRISPRATWGGKEEDHYQRACEGDLRRDFHTQVVSSPLPSPCLVELCLSLSIFAAAVSPEAAGRMGPREAENRRSNWVQDISPEVETA